MSDIKNEESVAEAIDGNVDAHDEESSITSVWGPDAEEEVVKEPAQEESRSEAAKTEEGDSQEKESPEPTGKIGKFIRDKISPLGKAGGGKEQEAGEKKSESKSQDNSELAKEVARYRRDSDENRRYARSVNLRNKNTLSLIKKHAESADIDDSVAEELIKSLEHALVDPSSDSVENEKISPLGKLNGVITEDVVNSYIEATGDKEVDNKMEAFKFCVERMSEQEVEDLVDAIQAERKTPTGVFKAIVEIGGSYWDAVYKNYVAHGGPDGYVKHLESENADLKSKLEEFKVSSKKSSRGNSAGTQWIGEYSGGKQHATDSHLSPLERDLPELFGKR